MPTYEYQCSACDHRFDVFQSIKDAPKRKCPKCGKNALERLIGTGAAVIFKGSGFYQTDYRSESYKKAAESDKSPSGGEGQKSADAPKPDKPAADKPVESKPAAEKPKPAEPAKASAKPRKAKS